MNIELLHHTSEPERTVALAARLCYSPTGLDELKEKIDKGETGVNAGKGFYDYSR